MILPPLSYLERYRNEGTRTYSKHSDYSEAAPHYQPASEQSGFTIHVFKVPRRSLNIYVANPPDSLRSMYVDSGQPLFCVHPQVIENCGDDPYVAKLKQMAVRTDLIAVGAT